MTATAMGFAIPAEFRLFSNAELASAISWISEPPRG
jgi:hypothetical protein